MHPTDICLKLGPDKIAAICDELNSNQLKSTLRRGGLNTKVPSRMVSQRAKRKLWSERVRKSLEQKTPNDEVAENLLYEWLLNHRRRLLMTYLDRIGVKHQGGETDETFTKTVPPATLREAALAVAKEHDPMDVAAYVLFLDHHQESDVYGSDQNILALLEGGVPDVASPPEAPDSTAAPPDTTDTGEA
jgi:hypothetical protein